MLCLCVWSLVFSIGYSYVELLLSGISKLMFSCSLKLIQENMYVLWPSCKKLTWKLLIRLYMVIFCHYGWWEYEQVIKPIPKTADIFSWQMKILLVVVNINMTMLLNFLLSVASKLNCMQHLNWRTAKRSTVKTSEVFMHCANMTVAIVIVLSWIFKSELLEWQGILYLKWNILENVIRECRLSSTRFLDRLVVLCDFL